LITAAREAGLSIPQDLAIVGFDDIAFAQFVHPALTTIAQPVHRLGRGAVEMVLALLSDDDRSEQTVSDAQVRGRLVVRASSGQSQPGAAGESAGAELSQRAGLKQGG